MAPDVVMRYLREAAAKSGFVLRLTLFGSRAREDARPFSDYDLAIELEPHTSKIDLLNFMFRVDEEAPTLCKISIVEASPSLRQELKDNIAREGIVIYER